MARAAMLNAGTAQSAETHLGPSTIIPFHTDGKGVRGSHQGTGDPHIAMNLYIIRSSSLSLFTRL